MRRMATSDQPPAECEEYKKIKIHRFDDSKWFCVKVWWGRQSKPYATKMFASPELREKWIEEQKANERAREERQASRKVDDQKRLSELLEQMQPGALLHYSWGWEQTNCEFYQVIERKGCSVIIRRIVGQMVPESQGYMSCQLVPVPDSFAGEPIKKTVRSHGLTMPHGIAVLIRGNRSFYSSWYA